MHEVKVYDSSGKLKKVISTQTLNIRSKQQLETPDMFLKSNYGGYSSSINQSTALAQAIQASAAANPEYFR